MKTRQLERRGCRLTDMACRGRIRNPLRDPERIERLLGPLLTVKTDGPGSNLSYSIARRGSADGLLASSLLSDALRMRSLSSAHFVCSVHDLRSRSMRCLSDRSRRDHTTLLRQGTVPTVVHRQPAAYTCTRLNPRCTQSTAGRALSSWKSSRSHSSNHLPKDR